MDKSLVEQINNSLVLEGKSINQIAKMLKCKRTDIFDIMKENGFTYDKEQGFFVKINEDSLVKRVEKLEEQMNKVILELLSNTKQKKGLKIENEDILNGEIVQKSYKLNKDIAERFGAYCKSVRGTIKAQDLISLALLEFLQKHE